MQIEPYSRSFMALVGTHARVERLWTGGKWCEGPIYLPEEDAVLWSDIPGNRVMRWKEAEGTRVWLQPSNFANGHALDREGRLISCEHGTRRVSRRERDGTFVTLASHYRGKRLNSPNDVVVKSDGSIWFTDPPYGILSNHEGYKAESDLGASYVFRLSLEAAELTVVADDFDKPNGLAFAPDESILYISDTGFSHNPIGPHHIRVFDVTDGCRLTRGRVFAIIEPGGPDGFCVDREGNLFTSAWDGIHVYAPDGQLLGKIRLPEKASNCTFGGRNGNRLFITAETSLYAVTLLTTGVLTSQVHSG